MSRKSSIADRSFLNKSVPKSPRYAHVGPTVDSGESTLSQIRKRSDNFVEHKYLQNELFIRIKPSLLARLIYETHLESNLIDMESGIVSRLTAPTRPLVSPPPTPTNNQYPRSSSGTPIFSRHHPMHHVDSVGSLLADHTAQHVEGDASECPPSFTLHPSAALNNAASRYAARQCSIQAPGLHCQKLNGSADSGYNHDIPYLLLDVREVIDWDQCHIIGAIPYPHTFVKRDQMSRDLVMYRNKEDRIIILYDNDESIAVPAAQTLSLRGFLNIYVLSGGLYNLSQRISGIFVGLPPRSIKKVIKSSLPRLQDLRTGSVTSSRSNTPSSSINSGRYKTRMNSAATVLQQSGVFNMYDLEQSLENCAATPISSAPSSRTSSRLDRSSDSSRLGSSLSSYSSTSCLNRNSAPNLHSGLSNRNGTPGRGGMMASANRPTRWI